MSSRNTVVKDCISSERQGQWLINQIKTADDFPNFSECEKSLEDAVSLENSAIQVRLWNMSDDEFDKIMDKHDEHDISSCPKCGCETVVSKDDSWICEKCSEVIV